MRPIHTFALHVERSKTNYVARVASTDGAYVLPLATSEARVALPVAEGNTRKSTTRRTNHTNIFDSYETESSRIDY